MTEKTGETETLRLPEDVQHELLQLCVNAFPYEACGYIVADRKTPTIGRRIVPMRNIHPDRRRAYDFDGAEVLAVHAEFDRRDEEPIVVWHSHPAGPPLLSDADLDGAVDLAPIHVIVSLQAGQPLARAWRITMPFIGVKAIDPVDVVTYEEEVKPDA